MALAAATAGVALALPCGTGVIDSARSGLALAAALIYARICFVLVTARDRPFVLAAGLSGAAITSFADAAVHGRLAPPGVAGVGLVVAVSCPRR